MLEIPPKILYRTNFTKLLHVFFPLVGVFRPLVGFVLPHYPFYCVKQVAVISVQGLDTEEIAMIEFQFCDIDRVKRGERTEFAEKKHCG